MFERGLIIMAGYDAKSIKTNTKIISKSPESVLKEKKEIACL